MISSSKWTRQYLDVDVLIAAKERISKEFDKNERICVSFSGGKDSGVLLHLVMEEAIRRERRVTVLFIDWEAQYGLTVAFIRECLAIYTNNIDPLWVCLPLKTVNACSTFEPEWICWDVKKRPLWVRDMPDESINTSNQAFPFYNEAMTFEDFVAGFEKWFDGAILLGLRAGESYDRYLGTFVRLKTALAANDEARLTSCPLYDWKTEDIWTYYARFSKPYNKLYDRMHQAGVSIHRMRVCEPYGNEQRQGLWQYHVIEPATWAKLCARVSGVAVGSTYAREWGNVLGVGRVSCPEGHTWQSFCIFLLSTMPSSTAEHYKNKIAVYLKWYMDHAVPVLPDETAGDLGAKEVGSWRRICRSLLQNDFWCLKLGFSPTKTHVYSNYQKLMAQRRKTWGLFAPEMAAESQ